MPWPYCGNTGVPSVQDHRPRPVYINNTTYRSVMQPHLGMRYIEAERPQSVGAYEPPD